MTEDFWLINSYRSRVKIIKKNKQNKYKFFEYIFIDSGRIIGVSGKEPPLITTREELEVDKARDEWEVNRSRFEKNQTSLGRLLITYIITRVSYVNY